MDYNLDEQKLVFDFNYKAVTSVRVSFKKKNSLNDFEAIFCVFLKYNKFYLTDMMETLHDNLLTNYEYLYEFNMNNLWQKVTRLHYEQLIKFLVR